MNRPARAHVAGGANKVAAGHFVENQHRVVDGHLERRRLAAVLGQADSSSGLPES